MLSMKFFCAFLLLMVTMPSGSSALSCYQCGIPNVRGCEENENAFVECQSPNDQYCAFINSTINDYNFVLRYCSQTQVSNCGASPTLPPSEIIVKESCETRSCNSDGCNSSKGLRYNCLVLVLLTIATFSLVM